MKNTILVATLLLSPALYAAGADSALEKYRSEGGVNFSASSGEQLWKREVLSSKDGQIHRCGSCHTDNLKQTGKHHKTGKPIEPMATSVNPARFTELKEIEKWFLRNCKWTWERECTPQEKGDLLTYLINYK